MRQTSHVKSLMDAARDAASWTPPKNFFNDAKCDVLLRAWIDNSYKDAARDASGLSLMGVFTLGDAQSFSGLTSKIPPLGHTSNFDADVKNYTTTRHQCENRLTHPV